MPGVHVVAAAKRRMSTLTAVLLAILVGVAMMPSPERVALVSSPEPAEAASSDWVCTLGGTLVAAGVGAATAGVTGILAGGAFTAGCQVGAADAAGAEMISGLPKMSNGCWWVFPHGNKAKKFKECVA